jgi:hypothetical protein
MQTGTLEAGIPARKFNDMAQLPHSHGTAIRTDIILSTPGGEGASGARRGPQAFLVEQSEESLAGSHYHVEAQFQVVVAGSGAIGRHELTPYTVHYANPYTGYGPILAGPQGLSYVTLRAVGDPHRPFYLPDSKDQMKPGPRLNLTSDAIPGGDPGGVKAAQCETVMAPRPDGIAVWMVRLPPNQSAPAPRHANGGGQFRLVVSGGMRSGDAVLARLGTAFHAAEESEKVIAAGPGGLEVLVLQFAGKPAE